MGFFLSCLLVLHCGCEARSNLLLGMRFINSIAGASIVVVCGVFRYDNRKFASLLIWSPPSLAIVFMAFLNVCTKRSAAPLELGWYGATRMFLMPLVRENSANSSDTN